MQCILVFLIVSFCLSIVCIGVRSFFVAKDNRYKTKNRSLENALYLAFDREQSK